MRFAYADPPYPGKAFYYRGRADFGGEVDHRELVERLVAEFPDGWALSTSARALPRVLSLVDEHDVDVRVAAWCRGSRKTTAVWPLSAWEPVVFCGGRRLPSRDVVDDALVYVSRPRLTDPARCIGSKPAAFAWWLFGLLDARPGDELVDLFPGSGGIGRAWARYTSAEVLRDGSRVDRGDASRLDRVDVSRRADPRFRDDIRAASDDDPSTGGAQCEEAAA